MLRHTLTPLLILYLCKSLLAHETDTNECKCECQQYCDQREQQNQMPPPTGVPTTPGGPHILAYGQAGQPGQPGIPGTPGVNGNHGIPGATGIPGKKGDSGLKGQKGDPGQIYQTSLESGNYSIMAQKGDMGEKGEQGLPGPPGQDYIGLRPWQRVNIAFSAGRTKTMTSQEPGTVITYNTLFVNVGYDFNKDTGVFTCRINGTYYFVMHVANFYDVGDNNLYVQLLKNGKHIVSVYHHDDSTYRDSVSNSVMLQLVRGDKVKLYLEGNRHLYSSSRVFTTFSGYLLFAD